MWITVDVERALYVDRGRNVILCELMPGPQTLVLKLKGIGMTDELQRLRSALENIADWRNVNISGEYEHGLRDIIRSIIDSAVAALDSPTQRPAPQAAPVRKWPDTLGFDDRDKYIDELEAQIERLRAVPQEASDSDYIEKLKTDIAFCREAMRHADIDLSMVLPLVNVDMQKAIRKTLARIDEAKMRSLSLTRPVSR
jgi:hypothetical protein